MRAQPLRSVATRPAPAILMLLAVGIALVFARRLNHDVAWYLYGAGQWLGGAKLYVDVVDVNPPLIFLVNVPPALVARFSGASDVVLFKVYVVLLVLLTLGTCRWLMRRGVPPLPADAQGLFLAFAVFTLLLLPHDQFGQREHLLFALTLPYILTAIGRAQGVTLPWRPGVLVGVLAALGLALKPYYLLLWVVVEVYVAVRRRTPTVWLHAQNAAFVVVLLSYAAFVLLVTPEYYRVIVPLVWQVYGAYDMPAVFLLTQAAIAYWLLGLGAALIVRRPACGVDAVRVPLLVTTVFLAIALIQKKGWDYHFYPAIASTYMLLVLAGHGLMTDARLQRRIAGVVLATLTIATVMATVRLAVLPGQAEYLERALGPRLEQRNFAVLSTSVYPAFPMVNHLHARWALRFNCLWPLPGLYRDVESAQRGPRFRPPDQMGSAERYVFDAVIADLLRRPPLVLLVDANPGKQVWGAVPFDFVEYFSQDERFRAWLEGYERRDNLAGFQVWRHRGAREKDQ